MMSVSSQPLGPFPPGGGGGPPPPGGGGGMNGFTVSGETYLTNGECGSSTTTTSLCKSDGTSNFISRSLNYNTTTGQFYGSIITNQCPAHSGDFRYANGTLVGKSNPSPICVQQTFPAPAYSAGYPLSAPLRGRIGLVVRTGVSLYNSFDAGFSMGMACDNGIGSCPAGTDVEMCENDLERQCGTAHFEKAMFMSDCNGHAVPYHVHMGLGPCEYNAADYVNQHSPLVGIMLDGRGLYGEFEKNNLHPDDLDACGGHFGPVPSTVLSDTEIHNGTTKNVYHYHVQNEPPFFIGCYGPVNSLSEAKNLYPSCKPGGTTCSSYTDCSAGEIYKTCTANGYYEYTLDCPIYYHMPSGEKFNQPIDNPNCIPCQGNCATGGATATPIPSPSSSVTPSTSPLPIPLVSLTIGLQPAASAAMVLNTTMGSTLRTVLANATGISVSLIKIISITYGPTGEVVTVDPSHPINNNDNNNHRRRLGLHDYPFRSSSIVRRLTNTYPNATIVNIQFFAPAGSTNAQVASLLSLAAPVFTALTSNNSSNSILSVMSSSWANTLQTTAQPVTIGNLTVVSNSNTQSIGTSNAEESVTTTLTIGAIIGIALASVVFLLFVGIVGKSFLLHYYPQSMRSSTTDPTAPSMMKGTTTPVSTSIIQMTNVTLMDRSSANYDDRSSSSSSSTRSTFEMSNPSVKIQPVKN